MVSLNGDLNPLFRPSQAWKSGKYGGKIPPEKAKEIRELLAAGFAQAKIAKRLGITQQCVSTFKTGNRKS